MFRIIFLLFFLCFNLQAQQKIFKARVFDARSAKPLAYARVVFKDYKLGVSADKSGLFSFQLPDSLMKSPLRISYVGYYEEIIYPENINDGIIKLVPFSDFPDKGKTLRLKETESKLYAPEFGEAYQAMKNSNLGLFPSIIARYFEKPEKFEGNCFIDQLNVYFNNNSETKDQKQVFRLHVYDTDALGQPGKDLLENYLVEVPENSNKVKLDLKKHKIKIPDDGFFIGLEHIFAPQNQYIDYLSIKHKETGEEREVAVKRYSPIFLGKMYPYLSEVKCYYYDLDGWKDINLWENKFRPKWSFFPAPILRIKFTN